MIMKIFMIITDMEPASWINIVPVLCQLSVTFCPSDFVEKEASW
jgi:hypothetical protein